MSPRILDARGVFFPYDADHKDLRKLYDKDGSSVATIRNYGAKFGKAVAVEPGITNVVTQSDFGSSFFGFNTTDGNQATALLTDGWRRALKQGVSLPNTDVYLNVNYTVSVGQRYTEQFLFRFNGSQPTFSINFLTNNGGHAVAPTLTHLGKGVWHAMATYVIESGGTSLRGIWLQGMSWGSSTYVDVTEPVLHLHTGIQSTITSAIRTSHVWGTRSAGLLRYNGWLLPRSEGTVSCWIRPNYDFLAFPSVSYHGIVASTVTNGSDQFRVLIELTSGSLKLQSFFGGGSQIDIGFVPADWSPGRLHHVAVTWSDAEQVVYYDGVRRATRVGSFTRWTEASLVTVGTTDVTAGTNALDGLVDDLAIFRKQLNDAQIKAIYA